MLIFPPVFRRKQEVHTAMRLAVNPEPMRRTAVRDLSIDGTVPRLSQSPGKALNKAAAEDSGRHYGNIRFAVVQFPADESASATELNEITRSEQLYVMPVHWRELVARGDAKNSFALSREMNDCVTFGQVFIDFSTQEAHRDGSPVSLTSMEFKTLKFFVRNPYRVITRDELLDKVWGYNNYPTTRTVDNRILRLRQKLERDAADPKHFRTAYGAGYKFVP
jgi:DNA-binding winged helix-turn-helix (wHTH) protein